MKKHNKIIAIQGDPIQSINRKTDTTLLLALEAQRRNYKIYYYETKNLTFSGNKIYALSKEVEYYVVDTVINFLNDIYSIASKYNVSVIHKRKSVKSFTR